MPGITLCRSDVAITAHAIDLLEQQVSARLPDPFRQFYLTHNGGVADKDWWQSNDDFEPIRISRFKAIAACEAEDAAQTRYLGGCYVRMTERQVIPTRLLPFASDDGGNFFCLDLIDGSVSFFANDVYDPDLTPAQNHLNAQRWLAASFEAFIAGLQDEAAIDLDY